MKVSKLAPESFWGIRVSKYGYSSDNRTTTDGPNCCVLSVKTISVIEWSGGGKVADIIIKSKEHRMMSAQDK
jgi:hypothetical protein